MNSLLLISFAFFCFLFPLLKLKGQLIAADIVNIKIDRIEIGRGQKKKFYKFKQAYASISFPISFRAEAYPDYVSLKNDSKQNWKLALFYFSGPLFYALILAIIFFGSYGIVYVLYKLSIISENGLVSQLLLNILLAPIFLSGILCLWCSLIPFPWRRNSGFKSLVCLWRGITNKPITNYPCVKKEGNDAIWGESYTDDVALKILKVWWTIMKWTVFIVFTLAIIIFYDSSRSDNY